MGTHSQKRTKEKQPFEISRILGPLIVIAVVVGAFILVRSAWVEEQQAELLPPSDTTAPVFAGITDLETEAGQSVSYRKGVTATDDVDGELSFSVNAEDVDIDTAGTYIITYTATDAAGNTASKSVTLTVTAPPEPEEVPEEDTQTAEVSDPAPAETEGEEVDNYDNEPFTEDMLWDYCDKVLASITNESMSQYDKAKAIYTYVHNHVKYVGGYTVYDWQRSAYVAFMRKRGDCFFYYACSRALLTRAGIDNVPMVRVGGKTEHFWNAVNTGDGWYHFDACPMPTGYSIVGYRIDEPTARKHTEKLAKANVRTNYFVYDYVNCPVRIVGWEEFATDYMTEAEKAEYALQREAEEQAQQQEAEEMLSPEELEELENAETTDEAQSTESAESAESAE